MSEFLTIRLGSRADQPVQWLVWSPQQKEVIASGQLDTLSQLSEITDYANQRVVYALVPAGDVLMTEVAIPAGSSRQLSAVLPFLLEEELAQDVDNLHVHLLQKSGDRAQVAVVEHQKVALWLAALEDAGIEIKALIPDCLCLPLFDNGFTAAEIDGMWLIRQSESLGVGADSAWLAPWLQSQQLCVRQDAESDEVEETPKATDLEQDEATASEELVVHYYTPAPEGMPGRWQAETPELVMQLLAQGVADSKGNLLSGQYKQQPAWRKFLKPWRKVAIAAGVLIAVMVAEHVISVRAMEQQALAYKAESERIFRQVLPQFQRVPSQSYLKRQMNSELSRLGGGGSMEGILHWLAELQPSLAKVSQLSVQNFRYDQNRNEMRFQAVASEFQHFEQLRTLLDEDFEVELGQLNREGNQVTGAIVLRRKS
ncbi:general secretion pathway protein L [Photobacterium gaetbulicola Gung47]|uniref:Type II secretion system protein L n=1 Tax=Photobacterium gaetbulicola Gung47 TaxID=658445 RepID=A0A0C5W608_9GAMM|nr:type II secretion system protein GspL [Photobacterium gaetbulicola]AJR06931.1 general secretion pathway protein L [Photobacterium gaetbulicola Gung47]